MHLTPSVNTCSMTELCAISAPTEEQFAADLKQLIAEAKGYSDKMIVANMHKGTHNLFGKALKAAGFRFIGRYYGNSSCWVYTWMYGLEEAPKTTKKPTLRARVRKAISR